MKRAITQTICRLLILALAINNCVFAMNDDQQINNVDDIQIIEQLLSSDNESVQNVGNNLDTLGQSVAKIINNEGISTRNTIQELKEFLYGAEQLNLSIHWALTQDLTIDEQGALEKINERTILASAALSVLGAGAATLAYNSLSVPGDTRFDPFTVAAGASAAGSFLGENTSAIFSLIKLLVILGGIAYVWHKVNSWLHKECKSDLKSMKEHYKNELAKTSQEFEKKVSKMKDSMLKVIAAISDDVNSNFEDVQRDLQKTRELNETMKSLIGQTHTKLVETQNAVKQLLDNGKKKGKKQK